MHLNIIISFIDVDMCKQRGHDTTACYWLDCMTVQLWTVYMADTLWQWSECQYWQFCCDWWLCSVSLVFYISYFAVNSVHVVMLLFLVSNNLLYNRLENFLDITCCYMFSLLYMNVHFVLLCNLRLHYSTVARV